MPTKRARHHHIRRRTGRGVGVVSQPRGILDGPAIAAALGLHPATIRQWAHRGWLTRVGTDHRQRALYDLTEAEQCATVTPRNRLKNSAHSGSTDESKPAAG